jgi:2-alkyl-3-oxoalkanoate reductase
VKQSILVLGADGFIGRKVVDGIAQTRWAVPIVAVRRRSAPATRHADERIIDITSTEAMRAALQGVDAVVNCGSARPQEIATCASALFEAAANLPKPVRIVHFSSMTVYGRAVGVVDESAPLRGDIGAYSAAQVAAEAAAAAYPRVVIFRPGCEFGPGSHQWSGRLARCLQAHRLGDLGAAGDGFCNVVDIEDLVYAVLRALSDPELNGRVFNLSHPEIPTWNEFLTRYGIALRAVPVHRISRRRLKIEAKVVAPALKAVELLADRCGLEPRRFPPPIPPSLVSLMSQEIRLDARRAQADLGLSWKDLDRTLTETARWFLKPAGAT